MGDVQDVHETTCEKLLPQPPKTRQAVDHVEELESRVESLEMQKQNMEKLFKKLEGVDSASPIDVSERMRRENRKKMGEVRIRQDEVQSELFEAGRLLSRARAKAEESDGSTGLWLRRVTDWRKPVISKDYAASQVQVYKISPKPQKWSWHGVREAERTVVVIGFNRKSEGYVSSLERRRKMWTTSLFLSALLDALATSIQGALATGLLGHLLTGFLVW
jgi:hypothetical protein